MEHSSTSSSGKRRFTTAYCDYDGAAPYAEPDISPKEQEDEAGEQEQPRRADGDTAARDTLSAAEGAANDVGFDDPVTVITEDCAPDSGFPYPAYYDAPSFSLPDGAEGAQLYSSQPRLIHGMRPYRVYGQTRYTHPYAMEAMLRPTHRDPVTHVTSPSMEDTKEERDWSMENQL